MEHKLAEFRARKKAQSEGMKPAERVIQSEMKAKVDDSPPAVCDDKPEQKPDTGPQTPHTEV